MISHFDEPFQVLVSQNGVVNKYFITPVYTRRNSEASFAVSIEGKELGKLKRHTLKRWIWEEGKAEQALADEIGLKIDDRFN